MRISTHQFIAAIGIVSAMAVWPSCKIKASDLFQYSGGKAQTAPEPEVDLKKGLVAHYPFSENAADESGNGFNLNLKGAKLTHDRHGNPNSAYVFNGKKNYLSFFGNTLQSSETTLSFWVKTQEKSGTILYFNGVSGNLYMLIRKVNHKFELEIKIDNKKIAIKDINQYRDRSAFNFFAITFDGKNVRFFVNNQLAGMKLVDKKLLEKFPFQLKKDPYFRCNSILDDIRVYSRVLNEMELETLFKGSLSTPELSYETQIKIGVNSAEIYRTVLDDGGSEISEMGVCWNSTGDPDTSDNKTSMGGYVGLYKNKLTGLLPQTKYYVKAYAVNAAGIGYSEEVFEFITLPDLKYGSVTDIDNNVYRTVTIGTQTWMAENLRTTRYADGTPIENGTHNLNDPGKFYYVFNDDTLHKEIYGLLYSWEGATNANPGAAYPGGVQGACPEGWHIPSYGEKEYLINYLGGPEMAAIKLKEEGDAHWDYANGTNESGFSALGSGIKAMEEEMFGVFVDYRNLTYFWTSESYKNEISTYFSPVLQTDGSDSHYWSPPTDYGAPVRCIMDHTISYIEPPRITTEPVTAISATKATGGGTVESDGGQFRIIRGICWSTKSNPDTSDFKTAVLDDKVTFTSYMTKLLPGTKYYVRAYGITSAGISYGNEVSFTTRSATTKSGKLEPDNPDMEKPAFDFYPNPATTVIHFRNITEKTVITIYDSQGKVVIINPAESYQLDISSVPNGVYYLKISDDKNTVIKKLIKQ